MKLLLHICCAPCAVAIVEKLQQDTDVILKGFYYNPNIHPIEENEKRRLSTVAMASDYNLPLTINTEDGMLLWKEKLAGNKLDRCTLCYSIRLDAAARLAKENGYDAFTTSLLISPYQNHGLITSIAEKTANKYGILFYYEDFRELYRKGREISRGKGFYMQKFCGCMYSYNESDHPKKPIYIFE